LRLEFHAGVYGPYAATLNKVLERIDGHYIRGYGDSQKPDAEIALLDGAVAEAQEYLRGTPASVCHLECVSHLIEGFETPYGMELLATLHWVATRNQDPATSLDEAILAIHAWSERKARMFTDQHVAVAWQRLADQGWLRPTGTVPPTASSSTECAPIATSSPTRNAPTSSAAPRSAS
jgi:hypothetical protein